jgi:hypothetical protein
MSKNKSIIYMAQCTLKRDLIYIGKTHQKSLDERIKQHHTSARKGDSTSFHQALIDYGFKNWEWTVIVECIFEHELLEEKKYIKKYGAVPIDLLNIKHGQKKEDKGRIKKVGNFINYTTNKSELGNLFLRKAGRIKPVINLKTGQKYKSASEASKLENIGITTIRLCCESGKMLKDETKYAYLDLNDNPVVTLGHSENHIIGIKQNTKRVKNLINGKIYRTVIEASIEYKIHKNSIDGNASGKFKTLKNKWVFCYLDSSGNELITENHRKGLEKVKKINAIKYVAWHIDEDDKTKSLKYFKSLDELINGLGLKSKNHIASVCTGIRTHVENWRIAYFDNYSNEPILTKGHMSKVKKVKRKIICLNNNKVFEDATSAGIFFKLNPSYITKCARGVCKFIFCENEKLRFAFLNADGKEILTAKHKEPLTNKGKKRIQLIKEGKLFNSLAEYLRYTGIPYSTAKRYLKDPSLDLEGYEFIELD